jgi:uncharacterized lipoprotein YmbA
MRRGILLVSVAILLLGGCASEPEKQWYKAAGNYTVKEWERDEAACTKDRVLDEECVKAKGWVPLSADLTKAPPPAKDPKGNPRY